MYVGCTKNLPKAPACSANVIVDFVLISKMTVCNMMHSEPDASFGTTSGRALPYMFNRFTFKKDPEGLKC